MATATQGIQYKTVDAEFLTTRRISIYVHVKSYMRQTVRRFGGRSRNYVYREESHINKGIHIRIPQMTDS